MSELDLNQIETIARNLRAVSDETYSAAVAVADVYNTTSSYDIGDYCIKSTLLYKCNTAIPSGEVWNSNHWDEICISDELNEIRGNVIHVGASAPSNPNVQLWLDTDEPGMSGVSSVNGATGTVVLDAADVGAMSKWDLLWTNASPTSSFATQTIQVDTSYDMYCIFYNCHANESGYIFNIFYKDGDSFLRNDGGTTSITAGSLCIFKRKVTKVANGFTFGSPIYAQPGTTGWGSYNDNGLIPTEIYGIKGVTA